MLTLPIRSLASLIAIDDDSAPARVHVALARPRVARNADGSAAFRLLRWTTAAGEAAGAGARLTLDAELQPGADEIAAAGLAGRDVLALPWIDARVRLDGPQFDAIEADVALVPGARASVAVDLSSSAAALLAPLLRADAVLPLQLTWSGHVWLRLPALEVVASADVSEVQRRLQLTGGGRDANLTRSVLDANAHVEIRAGAAGNAGDPALETVLREWALHELAARLAAGEPLHVRAAASDVVRWPIELATTLDDFVPAAARSELVHTLVLDDDEPGHVPPVEVRVFAEFGPALERVDVRLESLAGDRVVDLAFAGAAPQPARLGSTDYRWSYRCKPKDAPAAEWSAPREARGSTSLLLALPAAAATRVDLLAAGLDFATRWRTLRVVLEHVAPDATAVTGVVDLDASKTSASWTSPLTAGAGGARGSIGARLTFVSFQGSVVETALPVEAGQLIVRDPLDHHRLRFGLVPVGTGWADVALAMVDLRHVDGEHTVDETVELRRLDDFVEWEVAARPEAARSVQWRLHTSCRDGRFESGAWQRSDSGVIVVRIDTLGRRVVQLLPVYFDPALARAARVQLRSGDVTERIAVTDRTPCAVTLPAGPFDWTLAWTAADGTELPASAPAAGDDVIVLPRFVRS